jgi:hypothetical protein
MIDKLRYFFLGKQIQKVIDNTEKATRENAQWFYNHSNGYAEIVEKYKKSAQFEVDARSKLSELTHTTDPVKVISIRGDQEGNPILITIGTEKMTKNEIKNLKEEVIFYKRTRLYKILQETLKSQAQDMMFKKSKSYDDMQGGKYMLLNLDVQDRIMKGIESLDTTKMK